MQGAAFQRRKICGQTLLAGKACAAPRCAWATGTRSVIWLSSNEVWIRFQPMSGNFLETYAFDPPRPLCGLDDSIAQVERVCVVRFDFGCFCLQGSRCHRRRHWCRRHFVHLN